MATWKKGIIWTTGVLLALIGGCATLLNSLSNDMCATKVFDTATSPDGELQAVLFEIDCGATTGFNRQVSIAPASLRIDRSARNPDIPTSFFVAKGDREIRFRWIDDEHLEIQYPEGTVLYREDRRSNGAYIVYKPFRY